MLESAANTVHADAHAGLPKVIPGRPTCKKTLRTLTHARKFNELDMPENGARCRGVTKQVANHIPSIGLPENSQVKWSSEHLESL